MKTPALLIGFLLLLTTATADELQTGNVTDKDGDGPDGKGNTEDDTWGFWFALAHDPSSFRRLTRHSSTIPAGGVPGKVRGPAAGFLPNPADTEGWVLHTDWDARFEGIWGDKKTGEILAHPYVEKSAHMAVAITYKIPEDGSYVVSVGITDLQIKPEFPKHDGILWAVEVIDLASGRTVEVAKGGPVGDGHGRPDSDTATTGSLRLAKGHLVRLVIHPNRWWGQDLTRIDTLKIEKR